MKSNYRKSLFATVAFSLLLMLITPLNSFAKTSSFKQSETGTYVNQAKGNLVVSSKDATLNLKQKNENKKFVFKIKSNNKSSYALIKQDDKTKKKHHYYLSFKESKANFKMDKKTIKFEKQLSNQPNNQASTNNQHSQTTSNESHSSTNEKTNDNTTQNSNVNSNPQPDNNNAGRIYGDPYQKDANGETAYEAFPNAGQPNTYTFITGGGYWETRPVGY
ncbi:hypothetical protein [Fructilactobacillus carniphilus]|uniref:Uncharacterized protein n=1 Tax=Fructilactobacillus carniphilus TaxID=2940297 RepID=A0ABY5BVV1_9LACO|nr:hypothetical protein [Fructilactobacillus carniphilus]USS90356.1 hypothetical protein M3M37_05815 [Fructilactobacillus carniphilus]